MKKLFFSLFVVILIGLNIQSVFAASFTAKMSAPKSILAGEQFTVTLGVGEAVNYYGVSGIVNFDSNALTLVSAVGTNGFTVTNGSKLVADSVEGKSDAFNFATLTFKATANFVVGTSTSISFTGTKASDGSSDFSGSDASVSISMSAPKSTNNYLSSLSVSGATINFDKNTLSYKVIVENSVASVTLSASTEDPKASVSGIGTKTLKDYSNVFNIVVAAENGTKKTYSVNVVRKDASGNAGALSKNNNLATLTITGFELSFSTDKLDYALEVDNTVTQVEVKATVADTYAKMVISNSESLVVGNNTLTVTVTSENGDVKVYTVIVNRSGSAPTVPLDKLIDSFKTVTSAEIAVKAPEDGIINSEILAAIKESGKTLVIKGQTDGLSYEWQVDGSKIKDQSSVNTKLSLVSENQASIDTLSSYAKGIVLSFAENETLPEGTKVTLYVGTQYKDGDTLQLYYFNSETNKLEAMGEPLIVVEGKVVIGLTHTSDYLLTPAVIKTGTSSDVNIWFYISILEGLLLILGAGGFVFLNKKSLE
jgi:hypothetical protein